MNSLWKKSIRELSYLGADFTELELELMSDDSEDERDDVRLDNCTLEELMESSQRHSSIVMILTKVKDFFNLLKSYNPNIFILKNN